MSQPVDRKTFLGIFFTVFCQCFWRPLIKPCLSSWIAIGYMLASAASVPVYGWLGDQYGRKPMLMIALSIFALGSVICAFAMNMPWLVAGRIVQGLGSGGLMSLSQALIGELACPFSGLFFLTFCGGQYWGASVRWCIGNLPFLAMAVLV